MAAPNTLLDTVKANAPLLANPTSQPAQQAGLAPTTGEQTEQAQSLMGVAQTGKALPAATGQARLSAIGEKLASMNTLMGAQQIQQSAGLQSVAQGQQAQAELQKQQAGLANVSQQRVSLVEDYNNKIKGMMADQQMNLQKVDLQQDQSRMEQMGAMMRLSNDQYVTNLNNQATKARLDNNVAFNDALNRSVFASEYNMFDNNLQFRSMIGADDRTFERDLANINLDFAVQMAQADNKAASSQMMWSGIGSVGGAGMAAGAGALSGGGEEEEAGQPAAANQAPMQSAQNPAPSSPTAGFLGGGSTANYLGGSNG